MKCRATYLTRPVSSAMGQQEDIPQQITTIELAGLQHVLFILLPGLIETFSII